MTPEEEEQYPGTPLMCPYSGEMSDVCQFMDGERTDEHIGWHFDDMVRVGLFVDNGDGTFSLGERK
jgi:hypothetical protein